MTEAPLRMLLVEDDPSHVVLIRRALEGAAASLDLEVVDSVARARTALKANLPDVLVTDHNLPDGRGLELVGDGNLASRCPVILLTGHGDERLAVHAMRAGVADYLVKSAESIGGILPIIERAVREWKYRLAHEQAQREIRALKARLEAILATATGLAIFATNASGTILTVAGAAATMLGYSVSELAGRNLTHALRARDGDLDTAVPPTAPGFAAYVHAVREAEGRHDWRFVTKSGAAIDVELRVRELNDEEYVFVAMDVTARQRHRQQQRRLQQRTARSQKMESLGLFAGGIAHDFNNLLSCILGYSGLGSELAQRERNPEFAEFFSEIDTAGSRGRDLVAQILAFSRGDVTTPSSSGLHSGLRSVETFLRAVLPSAVGCTVTLPERDVQVAVSETQLHQMVVNLALNARDAMQGSGELDVSACEVSLASVLTCDSCQSDFTGPFVMVSIRNSGPAVPHEVFDKMFDPFFSGRPSSEQGTGMGLSVVHGILHRGGGHVCVSRGLPVEFRLYISTGPDAATEPRASTCVARPSVQAQIMVVDDEPAIARMLARALRADGHDVREYTSSEQALNDFLADPIAVDLLLTDQAMPQLRGTDLARQLLELRPDLPIILCSGYGRDMVQDSALNTGISAFLPKPVGLEELRQTVSSQLENRALRDARER